MNKIASRTRVLLMAVAAVLIGGALAGQAWAQVPGGDSRVDLGAARREIGSFESAVNGLLGEVFSANSFSIVQRAKGVYLPGYGVTFSFLINIHRAVMTTPFGTVNRRDADTPEQKKRRIEDLKDRLVRLMRENASGLAQLRKEDSVTIVAFFEDQNIPDEENQNKTIVLSVLKKDADELGRRDDRAREFFQRMRILEY